MRESTVEAHLTACVAKMGGRAYKFVSPGRIGVPDRIVLLQKGVLLFVELKAPGKKAKPHQLREHTRMRALGHRVEVLDSIEAVDAFVGEFE